MDGLRPTGAGDFQDFIQVQVTVFRGGFSYTVGFIGHFNVPTVLVGFGVDSYRFYA